jgi:hypothetical protein
MSSAKKSLVYNLKEDGKIEKEYIDTQNIQEIPMVKKGCYMLAIDDMFLLLDEFNDEFDMGLESEKSFATSAIKSMSVNNAFQTFFPESRFMGDIIAIKTKDIYSEELDTSEWDINVLKKYKLLSNTHCFDKQDE